MAQKSGTCGKTTVTFDENCGWCCNCMPHQTCNWTVSCPDGKGGWTYTDGTGLEVHGGGHTHPTVTVAGNLEAVAAILSKTWKRPVSVPTNLPKQTIEGTITGTHEEVAHALGLHLAGK